MCANRNTNAHIYTYINLKKKKKKTPQKKGHFLSRKKKGRCSSPLLCVCVHVPGCRSFLCPEAGASLCCHLNTETRPDSTCSAATAANQETVGRTNERENESSRHNDPAQIQVKTTLNG